MNAEVIEIAQTAVTLDDKTVEKAREIGCGNVSQGIRTAVEAYTKGAK